MTLRGGAREGLERRACDIVRGKRDEVGDPRNLVAEQIELLLEELSQQSRVREERLGSLLRCECYVGTELRRLKVRAGPGMSVPFSAEAELQRRLLRIEEERRRVAAEYEATRAGLYQSLLSLVQRHEQLILT